MAALVPTSLDIFPQAWQAALAYLQLRLPPDGNPFNALQQLTYFALIFFLAPLQILTPLAMSPAVAGRLPWYPALFRGRQVARSIHFLGLVAFISFIVHHLTLVVAHGLGNELAKIVLGIEHGATPGQEALAIAIMGAWLVLVGIVHVWATRASHASPRSLQQLLDRVIDPVKLALFHHLTSRQHYLPSQRSAAPRVNGRPPADASYQALARNRFADWRLEVRGLVEQPRALTLADLHALERQTQTTKHNCIQGWSYIAEWTGVPLRAVLEGCRPLAQARYVVLYAMDNKSESEPEPEGPGRFYETVDLELANHPQTIIALEMNGEPLSIEHGAPARLRVETQLGFKMVKWLRAIELVEDYRPIRGGMGGSREDNMYYEQSASV